MGRDSERSTNERDIIFVVPFADEERDAKKIHGYAEFLSVLAFDETESLTGVEVWE